MSEPALTEEFAITRLRCAYTGQSRSECLADLRSKPLVREVWVLVAAEHDRIVAEKALAT